MKKSSKNRPELLLPVGNIEAFYAALKGGADAIFLGLKSFNARNRASNFSPWQLAAIVNEAHQQNVQVYVTLNTVVRNHELDELINTIYVLSQVKPDAVIVQDWGVYYLIKKYFPHLSIHASTQMANHNSVGANYSHKLGIERVVMARELTKTELSEIAGKSKAEIELFVHGALCYSFSGMCLFSSFLGGASANRGRCAQPCRRNYSQHEAESYFFSLKDNQLIEHLPFVEQLGIDSLKIEGRIKSAEYVYQVAMAYRMALDHPEERARATQILQTDFGREKTDYFYGKKVGEAITQSANTGLYLGEVESFDNGLVTFQSAIELSSGCRLRIRSKANDEQTIVKVDELESVDGKYCFTTGAKRIAVDDEVYLASLRMKFPSRLNTTDIKIQERMRPEKLKQLKSGIKHKSKAERPEIYLRIDSLEWLPQFSMEAYTAVLLNLSRRDLAELNPQQGFIQKHKQRIFIELPKFIPESDLLFYQQQIQRLVAAGITNFSLSHLSQKELLPKQATFITNENVYAFNDAAIRLIKQEGASRYVLPLENDIVNLAKGTDKAGIIPVYFYPQLFYSRMPVKAKKEELFEDKMGEKFRKIVRDGITIVLPENPVSLTQYQSKLERYGFNRFLIDVSSIEPSSKVLKTIVGKLKRSESVPGSSNFNFKRELK